MGHFDGGMLVKVSSKRTAKCTIRYGMSISADIPSDETLNRGPLALLLRRQYEFPFGNFGINIVQFSIFSISSSFMLGHHNISVDYILTENCLYIF